MKLSLFFLKLSLVNAFISTDLSTHSYKNVKSSLLFSKRFEIYRLRRQKEILNAFESIFTRQRGLPIGHNILPELIHGISIMDVKLSTDCSHATVYILPSGDSFQQRQCFSWVNRNSKRLRYLMAQLLKYRKSVPTIQFEPYELGQSDLQADYGKEAEGQMGAGEDELVDEEDQLDGQSNGDSGGGRGLILMESV